MGNRGITRLDEALREPTATGKKVNKSDVLYTHVDLKTALVYAT